MKISKVTLTGIDDAVDPWDVCHLFDEFPFVEFGILRSKSREGTPRYPSKSWIEKLLYHVGRIVPLSFHICGKWSRDAVHGCFSWAILNHDEYERASRIQLNLPAHLRSIDNVAFMASELAKELIIQVNEAKFVGDFGNAPYMNFLVDASGGAGKELSVPKERIPAGRIGFAGGITPENISSICDALCSNPSPNEIWIDMESGVRTDDKFDVAKAKSCLRETKRFIE